MLYGYENLVRDIRRLIDTRQFSGGYLFFGPSGVGKYTCALHVARYMHDKNFDSPGGILQDLLVVGEQEAQGSIGIEEIREAGHFLHMTPTIAFGRVVIIRDAHRCTDQAQNALLKILEETPSSGIIIVIAHDPGALFDTVSSRTRNLYFPRLPDNAILDFLRDYGKMKGEVLSEGARYASGSLGRAQRFLEKKREGGMDLPHSLARAIIALSPHEASISSMTDTILSSAQDDMGFIPTLFEELLLCLGNNPEKNVAARGAISVAMRDMALWELNKRIFVKHTLWQILSSLSHSSS